MTCPARAVQSKPSVVESLERERDRFVALAFCAADVLIEADADCGITYAAGATVGVTGYPADQLVGDSLLKIVAADFSDFSRTKYSLLWPADIFPAIPGACRPSLVHTMVPETQRFALYFFFRVTTLIFELGGCCSNRGPWSSELEK